MEQFGSFSGILFICLCGAAVGGWWIVFIRISRGLPVLPLRSRQPVPWGFVDVLMAFLFWFGAGATSAAIALSFQGGKIDEISSDAKVNIALASSLGSLVGAGMAVFLISLKNRTRLSDWGVALKSIGSDLLTGVGAFLLLAGPVYLIQALLVQWWPSEHPLIELVKENPSIKFVAVSTLSAVVVAPIVEELVFRVLLQGWLEAIPLRREDPAQLLIGRMITDSDSLDTVAEAANPAGSKTNLAAYAELSDEPSAHDSSEPTSSDYESGYCKSADQSELNPYRPPTVHTVGEQTSASQHRLGPSSRMMIVISAIVFALFHFSHGPDMIALTVFALGLGYMYQQTHRVLPCIVTHLLLNAVSVGMLALEAFSARAEG